MADEGPTTAGSIVGKLKMDRDQWLRDKTATIADARELAALDPTITVHANVAEALTQLNALHAASGDTSTITTTTVGTGGSAARVDAVSAAEARLAAAISVSESATGRAQIAEMRLNEARESGKRSTASLAAAEFAAAEAIKKSEVAAAKAAAAEDALAAAQQKAAASALEDATAQDVQAKATDNAGRSMSRIQMILTAVVALGPGLIPIAGFAVGAGAAVSAMAGVAVLAILGIRKELKAGTADGDAFAAGLGSLKTDVAQLEATAAKGVLGGFSTVVAELRNDMPELSTETALYSKVLGAIAAVGFGGLLSSFHQLQPLILDVDSYLLHVVGSMSKFAASPAMRQFVTYAQRELPTVEALLNSLVNVAFHVLAAFAPWGAAVVDVLTAVSNVISGIPTPVLSALIELALGGSLAFKAWSSIPGMLTSVATSLGAVETAEGGATVATGALGAAIDFATGPIGWVVAGLGALIAVLGATAAAQAVTTASTSGYVAALQQDNGVLGDNVKLQAAKALQDAGAIEAAKRQGISVELVTKANLGNAAAMKKLITIINEHGAANQQAADKQGFFNDKQKQTFADLNTITEAAKTNAAAIKSSIKTYNDEADALGTVHIKTAAQYDVVSRLAAKYGMSVPVYQAAVVQQSKVASQSALTTAQLQLENDAATLLANTFTILNGGTLSLAQAQTGVAAANNSVIESMRHNKTAIDGNSAAAVANQQAIQGQVQAAQEEAEAVGNATGSSKKAAAAYLQSKSALEAQLRAQHLLTPAVQKYIDQLYDIKDLKIPPTQIDVDDSTATAKLKALQRMFDTLSRVTVHVSASGSVSYTTQGGRVNFFADGGTVGGTVRGKGSTTSDSNIIAVSNDEEVTNAARARRFRPMLKAINNGSGADITAQAAKLAGGGAPSVSVSSPVIVRVINKVGVALDDLIDLHIQSDGVWQQVHANAGGGS